jgi:hypothetical protein
MINDLDSYGNNLYQKRRYFDFDIEKSCEANSLVLKRDFEVNSESFKNDGC